MIDGQNYSIALGSSDAIQLSPHRSASCCARIWRDGQTGWCHLPDDHEGSHEGVLSAPPPPEEYGPRSRR
jgi:hypothetical protein